MELQINQALDKYTTSADIARMAGTDLRWVQRWVRRGVAQPVLFLGERQFDRAGVVKLLLLAKLQAAFGENSHLPLEIVEQARSVAGLALAAADRVSVPGLRAPGPRLVAPVAGDEGSGVRALPHPPCPAVRCGLPCTQCLSASASTSCAFDAILERYTISGARNDDQWRATPTSGVASFFHAYHRLPYGGCDD